jgi:hypothetical protein
MSSQTTQPACFILINAGADECDRFSSMAMIHLIQQIDNAAPMADFVLWEPLKVNGYWSRNPLP